MSLRTLAEVRVLYVDRDGAVGEYMSHSRPFCVFGAAI